MANALIDNDILFKTTIYNLTTNLLDCQPYEVENFHILAAAKFMLRKRLEKYPPARGNDAVIAELELIFSRINLLEPSNEEIQLAAELEYIATKAGRDLDSGESQLCAILLKRQWDYIFTGDKRAIFAVETLIDESCPEFQGKITSLEQLIAYLTSCTSFEELRNKICTEPGTDKTLDNCFACRSEKTTLENCLEGLKSYIKAIKVQSPRALLDLSK